MHNSKLLSLSFKRKNQQHFSEEPLTTTDPVELTENIHTYEE